MSQPLTKLCRYLGYTFQDIKHLRLALTHRSAAIQNNERFEFLGDSLLNMIIAEALFMRLNQADEGNLTRLRAALVCRSSLAQIAAELHLEAFIQLGPGELKSGGTKRPSILADALEAVIAAIYLDGGFANCKGCVLAWFESHLAQAKPGMVQAKDPKTRLQEYLQSRKLPLPEYKVISIDGHPHEQIFQVSCCVRSLDSESQGTGSSRQKAEQDAARNALVTFDE